MRTTNVLSGRALMLGSLAALVIAALVITGCGGSGGDSSGGGDTSGGETSAATGGGQAGGPGGFEISDEARACLEEKGVELPEPGQGGGPPEGLEGSQPPEGLEGGEPPEGKEPPAGLGGGEINSKAFEECGIEMQGKPGGANASSAEFKEQIKEYVACVRENGYDLPEPNFSGEGPVFSESEVDQSDPKFKEASEACQDKLAPQGGGEAG